MRDRDILQRITTSWREERKTVLLKWSDKSGQHTVQTRLRYSSKPEILKDEDIGPYKWTLLSAIKSGGGNVEEIKRIYYELRDRDFRVYYGNDFKTDAVPHVISLMLAKRRRWKEQYRRKFKTLQTVLFEYWNARYPTKPFLITEITSEFGEDFIHYQIEEKELQNETTIGYIKNLGALCKFAKEEGYDINPKFDTSWLPTKSPNPIYLAFEEKEKLENVEIKSTSEKRLLDQFLFRCTTGIRHGDLNNISISNLKNGRLIFTSEKGTKGRNFALSKNGISMLERVRSFTSFTRNYESVVIQRLCKRANINEEVRLESYVGKTAKSETKKKHEIVSTHTARRTWACLANEKGMNIYKIRDQLGHKSIQTTEKYIGYQADDSDVAALNI